MVTTTVALSLISECLAHHQVIAYWLVLAILLDAHTIVGILNIKQLVSKQGKQYVNDTVARRNHTIAAKLET